jgi:(2Fe-2S) ferredoxin
MILYPQGLWFGEVNEEKVDSILDALEDGEPMDELILE